MLGLHACEACGGHGPFFVRLDGELTVEPDSGGVQHNNFSGYETWLCAYCKADLSNHDGLTVEELERPA